MTKAERNLEREGYRFTGIYTRDMQEAKERALLLRKEGKLARVSGKRYPSRGGSTLGYSVYSKDK